MVMIIFYVSLNNIAKIPILGVHMFSVKYN